jgi:hypothetical protein
MSVDHTGAGPLPEPADLEFATAELDIVESSGAAAARRRRAQAAVRPPQVRLGALVEGGLAPAVMVIIERSVRRRPAMANSLRCEIELAPDEDYPPVRIVFGDRLVLVEDGPGVAPDIRAEGSLPDLIALMVTPLLGGYPNPMDSRGRAALGKVALGHVRFEGRVGLAKRLLSLIRV